MKTGVLFCIISRFILLRIRNVSDTRCRENQNTHVMFNNFLVFRKSSRIWDNVEKYFTAGQTTDDNMALAHCMLGTQGYKHTLRICNIYYFTTETVIARTRLNITFIRTLHVMLLLPM